MKAFALLLAVSASSFVGCSSAPDRTGRSTQGFFVPSYETLWERANEELRQAGYPPDGEASNKVGKVLVSRWDTSLMPFSGKGTREQATLTFHEVPDRPSFWTVEANVLREQNMNLKDPSNPRKAEWKNATRVPEQERLLVHRIETFFLGYEVSPQFRDRYGLGRGREVIAPRINPDTPEGKAEADKKAKELEEHRYGK